MTRCLTAAAILLGLAMTGGAAQAKGCIKGALIGGLAGHAAHHTFAGAAAGCAIGHHYANKKDKSQDQDRQAPAR